LPTSYRRYPGLLWTVDSFINAPSDVLPISGVTAITMDDPRCDPRRQRL
jgi:hypothetical protein